MSSLPPQAPRAHFVPSPCETNNLFNNFLCFFHLLSLSFPFYLQQECFNSAQKLFMCQNLASTFFCEHYGCIHNDFQSQLCPKVWKCGLCRPSTLCGSVDWQFACAVCSFWMLILHSSSSSTLTLNQSFSTIWPLTSHWHDYWSNAHKSWQNKYFLTILVYRHMQKSIHDEASRCSGVSRWESGFRY